VGDRLRTNITAMMGMVMIIGIEMAIVLGSDYQALRPDMPLEEAVREAIFVPPAADCHEHAR
jgi:hypothetical protein